LRKQNKLKLDFQLNCFLKITHYSGPVVVMIIW